MSAASPSPPLYLPDVEANHQPGIYRELIALHLLSERVRVLHAGTCRGGQRAPGDETLVWTVLRDLEHATLDEKTKRLLRFVGKMTKTLPTTNAADIDGLRAVGWDDEAIYYVITTCALFNFYNRWITATGVPVMSVEGHRQQGKALAARGYVRD